MKILFGANDTYIDVTKKCLDMRIDQIITIPRKDYNRTFYFSDPLYDVLKHIVIIKDDQRLVCDDETEILIDSQIITLVKPHVKIIYGLDCSKIKILLGDNDITQLCKKTLHNNIITISGKTTLPVEPSQIILSSPNKRIVCDSFTDIKINMSTNTIFTSNRLGFIMLRHVNNEFTSKYWEFSYDCIRKFYPENTIIIIDDNSNYEFVKKKELYNTIIIQSEYPGRGELLPYIYFLKNKAFDIAVIIHDSVFLNSKLNINVDKCKFLWDFTSNLNDNFQDETQMLNTANDNDLMEFHRNKNWAGCFGCMTIITYDFLSNIQKKFNFHNLINMIKTKHNRCSFERVISVLFNFYGKCEPPMFGDIHKYCPWGIKLQQIRQYFNLPVIKVWTGR